MKFCSACAAFYNDACPEHGIESLQPAFGAEELMTDLDRLEGYRGDTEASVANALNTPFARAMLKDDVAHPQHYARWKMEPIEFIAINDLPWWLANVIKYTMRYDAKDGLKDLYKARSYLDMKIRQIEGAERFWDKPVSEERKLNGK